MKRTCKLISRSNAVAGVVATLALMSQATVFAAQPSIAYDNNTNTHVTVFVRGEAPVEVKKLDLQVDTPSKVMVSFTSSVSAESSKGCPCSVRAMIAMDDQEPRVVKRINVGSPAVQAVDKYQWDRQGLDGSTVYEVPAGKHTFKVIFKQAGSAGDQLEVNYPNLQVITFPG